MYVLTLSVTLYLYVQVDSLTAQMLGMINGPHELSLLVIRYGNNLTRGRDPYHCNGRLSHAASNHVEDTIDTE